MIRHLNPVPATMQPSVMSGIKGKEHDIPGRNLKQQTSWAMNCQRSMAKPWIRADGGVRKRDCSACVTLGSMRAQWTVQNVILNCAKHVNTASLAMFGVVTPNTLTTLEETECYNTKLSYLPSCNCSGLSSDIQRSYTAVCQRYDSYSRITLGQCTTKLPTGDR